MTFWPISSENWLVCFFVIIGEKASTNLPLKNMYSFFETCKTDMSIWSHVLKVGLLPPILWLKIWYFWDKHQQNLRCCHEYTKYVGQKQLIDRDSKIIGMCFILNLHKHNLSFPFLGQLYVIILMKIMCRGIHFMLVEMLNHKNILSFRFIFQKSPIIVDDITGIKLMKIKSNQLFNIY